MSIFPAPEEPELPEGMTKLLNNVGFAVTMGTVFGSIQSAWLAPHKMTDGVQLAEGVLPSFRTMWFYVGGNAAKMGGVAVAYTLAESVACSMRGGYDWATTMSAAFAAGTFVGTSATLKASNAFFYGLCFSIIGLAVHMTGGSFSQDVEKKFARNRGYRIID